MIVSDQDLMAYVDGELDPVRHEALSLAIERDAGLAARVAAAQELRRNLRAAFDVTLHEPVPDKLTALLTAGRDKKTKRPDSWRFTRSSAWASAFALAAGVVFGAWLGPVLMTHRTGPGATQMAPGRVATGSDLYRALSEQLASAPAKAIRMELSFRSKEGTYCRVFASTVQADTVTGLACRDAEGWRVDAMQSVAQGANQSADYRQAGSSMPSVIMALAESRMEGDALDADAEASARANGWIPASNTH